jgi:hypothetical protein
VLYLVGPFFKSRLSNCLSDGSFLVFLSFSRQMATRFPNRRYMCLANTEFCKYLSIITEVTDMNLFKPVSQTADFTARINVKFETAYQRLSCIFSNEL